MLRLSRLDCAYMDCAAYVSLVLTNSLAALFLKPGTTRFPHALKAPLPHAKAIRFEIGGAVQIDSEMTAQI